MHPIRIHLVIAALLTGMFASQVAAQVISRSGRDAEPESQPLPADFDPRARGLEPTPFVADELGLSIHLPAGSTTIVDRSGGSPRITIQENAQPSRWSMLVQRVTGMQGGPPLTPSAHIDGYLRRLDAAGVPYRVLRNEPMVIRGVGGHICFLEQRSPDGQRYVSGWLALPTGAAPRTGQATLLEFAVLTLPAHFEAVRPLLDRSLDTIGLRTAAAVEIARRRMIEEGRDTLAALTPERLRSLVGASRWFRVYRPAPPGSSEPQRELGYSLVEVSAAKNGVLNPEKDERDYLAGENDEGLLVRVQGRAIDPASGSVYDSLGLYWLAWDQSSESWSVRATYRAGEATNSKSEMGIRRSASTGDPVPRLTVVQGSAESFQRQNFEWGVPEAYLSQALTWVLGRLLPREPRDEPLELAYYVYSSRDEPTVTLRRDRWRPAGDGTADWVLETRLGGDQVSTESIYDSRGNLVRRIYGDGSVTEPISLAALRRLWRERGLQMGRDTR